MLHFFKVHILRENMETNRSSSLCYQFAIWTWTYHLTSHCLFCFVMTVQFLAIVRANEMNLYWKCHTNIKVNKYLLSNMLGTKDHFNSYGSFAYNSGSNEPLKDIRQFCHLINTINTTKQKRTQPDRKYLKAICSPLHQQWVFFGKRSQFQDCLIF